MNYKNNKKILNKLNLYKKDSIEYLGFNFSLNQLSKIMDADKSSKSNLNI